MTFLKLCARFFFMMCYPFHFLACRLFSLPFLWTPTIWFISIHLPDPSINSDDLVSLSKNVWFLTSHVFVLKQTSIVLKSTLLICDLIDRQDLRRRHRLQRSRRLSLLQLPLQILTAPIHPIIHNHTNVNRPPSMVIQYPLHTLPL